MVKAGRRGHLIGTVLAAAMTALISPAGFAIGSPGPDAAAEPPHETNERLQGVIEAALEEGGGVGISAAVLLPGQLDWSGAAGVSDPAAGTPLTPQSIFCIASIAKTFEAAVIIQLAEEKRLSLDARAADLLPGHAGLTNGATVRQLLNHTSGIFDFVEHPNSIYRDGLKAPDLGKVWTSETILSELTGEPYFAAGTGWHYSTTNYVLLSMIIERHTGQNLASAVRSRLLEPLQLTETRISLDEALAEQEHLVHGWFDFDGDGSLDDTAQFSLAALSPWAEAGMFATARDLAHWAQHLYSGRVFGRTFLDEVLTFHRPTPGEDWMDGYGLGTATGDAGGIRWWGHAGLHYGFKSGMLYLPRGRCEYRRSLQRERQDSRNSILHVGTRGNRDSS